MTINIRQKGQDAEREIARMLNDIVNDVRVNKGFPAYHKINAIFQRNQNQSAVGGSDLCNPLGLEIEVKRQESLAVNTWWNQCVDSANRTNGIPILIFRQNRQKWRVCMLASLPLSPYQQHVETRYMIKERVEISLDVFKRWFRSYCYDHYVINKPVVN